MGNFPQGWGFIMLTDDSLVQVGGSKEGQTVPSDFLGYVSDETHSVGSVIGNDSIVSHLL